MGNESLRINFVLPPSPKLTGGPLAIIEYAKRLKERGHQVSLTTYTDAYWETDKPFPWADFDGPIYYLKASSKHGFRKGKLALVANVFVSFAGSIFGQSPKGIGGKSFRALLAGIIFSRRALLERALGEKSDSSRAFNVGAGELIRAILAASTAVGVMPECDLNIATFWATAFPVLWSGKGKPVYFMQHYEEVFYSTEFSTMLMRLGARMSYELPMHKVANSSWLSRRIEEKFGQRVPFSNNGLDLSVFKPASKASARDGKIRLISYSRPEEWKGFADAVEIVKRVRIKHPDLEWNVFGFLNPILPPDNSFAPYTFKKGLSYEELSGLYAESDIALCPSWYESFPLPPIEAMAAGTAVVTTDYGTEDYARDRETALVFGPRDVKKGSEAVIELIENSKLREELAARGEIESRKFAWDAAVDAREKILQSIHAGNSTYDRFSPLNHGFRDGNNILYSEAPVDLKRTKEMLVRLSGDDAIYVFDGKSRRKLANSRLQEFTKLGEIQAIDALTFARTPEGYQII